MPRYELNISVHGQHFARVDFGDCSELEATTKANIIRLRFLQFPEYRFMLTSWSPSVGKPVELINL